MSTRLGTVMIVVSLCYDSSSECGRISYRESRLLQRHDELADLLSTGMELASRDWQRGVACLPEVRNVGGQLGDDWIRASGPTEEHEKAISTP
ncbi:hypothetical protein HOY80DRAFT_1138796 [Tuber brumale]|nr:hypothetical protein HOY80DRAFT_1138796 [Tuber brumale]